MGTRSPRKSPEEEKPQPAAGEIDAPAQRAQVERGARRRGADGYSDGERKAEDHPRRVAAPECGERGSPPDLGGTGDPARAAAALREGIAVASHETVRRAREPRERRDARHGADRPRGGEEPGESRDRVAPRRTSPLGATTWSSRSESSSVTDGQNLKSSEASMGRGSVRPRRSRALSQDTPAWQTSHCPSYRTVKRSVLGTRDYGVDSGWGQASGSPRRPDLIAGRVRSSIRTAAPSPSTRASSLPCRMNQASRVPARHGRGVRHEPETAEVGGRIGVVGHLANRSPCSRRRAGSNSSSVSGADSH